MCRIVTAKIRRSFSLLESSGAVMRTKKPRDGGKKGRGKRKQVGGGEISGAATQRSPNNKLEKAN